MKAQGEWEDQHLRHQAMITAPKTIAGATRTGSKTAMVQKAIDDLVKTQQRCCIAAWIN